MMAKNLLMNSLELNPIVKVDFTYGITVCP